MGSVASTNIMITTNPVSILALLSFYFPYPQYNYTT